MLAKIKLHTLSVTTLWQDRNKNNNNISQQWWRCCCCWG